MVDSMNDRSPAHELRRPPRGRLRFLVAAAAPLLALPLLAAGADDAAPAAPPLPAPIASVDLARETVAMSSRLREIETIIRRNRRVSLQERDAATALAGLESLEGELIDGGLDEKSSRGLEDLRRAWQLGEEHLHELEQELAGETRELGVVEQELALQRQRWQATEASFVSDTRLVPLVAQVEKILASIDVAEASLREPLDRLLALQGRIGEGYLRVAKALDDIDNASDEQRRTLLRLDGPPLWKGLGSPEEGSGERRTRPRWEARRRSLVAFLRAYPRRLLLHGLLLAGVVWLLIVMRRRIPPTEASDADEAEFEQGSLAARTHPVSTALVAVLPLTTLLYPRAPSPVYSLAFVISLIPMAILAKQLFGRLPLLAFYGFALICVVDRAAELVVIDSRVYRLVLLGEGMAAIPILAALLPSAFPTRPRQPTLRATAIRLCSRLAVLTFAAAVIANTAGNVSLARHLTDGMIAVTYTALGLRVALLVGVGAWRTMLGSDLGARLRMVRAHGPLLARRGKAVAIVAVWSTWLLSVLDAFGWLVPLTRETAGFLRTPWPLGFTSLRPSTLLLFLGTVAVATILTHVLQFVLEEDVLPRLPLAQGMAATISMLLRYTLLSLGFVLALMVAGVDLNRFTILAGALGVGVGFGLQNLVNHFTAGLILAFERPIRVGDTIEVGPLLGEVRTIGARASTIRTFDGAEVVMPNGNLISTEVVNWTLSDRLRRIEVKVPVAYGSDPRRVMEILVATGASHPKALKHPAPQALFRAFGDSSLDFLLRFWTADFENWLQVQSDVTLHVHAALGATGIAIPFPQRDVHVRSITPGAEQHLSPAPAGKPTIP
jgi:small-conductance mechanosensitive channel